MDPAVGSPFLPGTHVATPGAHLASVRLVDARRGDYLWVIRDATQQTSRTDTTDPPSFIDQSLIERGEGKTTSFRRMAQEKQPELRSEAELLELRREPPGRLTL